MRSHHSSKVWCGSFSSHCLVYRVTIKSRTKVYLTYVQLEASIVL